MPYPFLKLSEPQQLICGNAVEAAMGLHIVRYQRSELQRIERPQPAPFAIGFVLGGTVLFDPSLAKTKADAQEFNALMSEPWMRATNNMSCGERENAFETWMNGLDECGSFELLYRKPLLDKAAAYDAELQFPQGLPVQPQAGAPWYSYFVAGAATSSAPAASPSMPPAPPSIYGHVPFHRVTAPSAVFYRCEPWPTSRRIQRTPGQLIAPGTFAIPASELPLVPTGFAAVGRYALPFLPPACFRWELQPMPGTPFQCGASVPLYGQAGGGVEVVFHHGASNRCPFADPVILPEL